MGKNTRQGRVEEVIERFTEQLRRELGDDRATLDEIEERVERVGRQIMKKLEERLVEERTKRDRPNRVECSCGARASYKDQASRSIVTSHGSVCFRRPCYWCPSCKKSIAPLDEELGIRGSTSTRVRVWSVCLCGQLPFSQSQSTLELLTGVCLSASTLERITVAVGASLQNERHTQAALHQAGEPLTMSSPFEEELCRLYVTMDGSFVPVRDEWKKDRSLGALSLRWNECKLGVVYQAQVDQAGRDSGVKRKAYTATLQGVETFAPMLSALAHKHGQCQAKEVLVLGDGAPWIWNLANERFPGAVQVLDFFHACQHLADYADARFGAGTKQSQEWLAARKEELKTQNPMVVIKEIASWLPAPLESWDMRNRTFKYFLDNLQRMDYKRLIEKGYHIGSGVVEAGCKHAIGQRLDQAGMHWRPETAEAIAAIRAAQCSTNNTDIARHCQWAA